MIFKKLDIPDLVLITPDVFGDDRGFFKETYNKQAFLDNGIDVEWIQDNHSRSSQNVLRGLHWQTGEYAQDKLVRVARGKVLDVAVDLRKNSPTFKNFEMVELSDENHNMFLVPKGFAHGFAVLSDIADFEYKVSTPYSKENEGACLWNDPDIGIDWGITNPVLSEKDKHNPMFKDINPKDLF